MSSILEKIRKAREINVDAGGFTFTVRRPTDMEVLVDMRAQVIRQGDLLRRFVVGWSGVTELDIIPGGSGAPVAFDSELFIEWVADRPELWDPLTAAVVESYKQHRQQLEDAEKKSQPGSSAAGSASNPAV